MYECETHPIIQQPEPNLLITLTVFVIARYTNTDRKLPSVRPRAKDETIYICRICTMIINEKIQSEILHFVCVILCTFLWFSSIFCSFEPFPAVIVWHWDPSSDWRHTRDSNTTITTLEESSPTSTSKRAFSCYVVSNGLHISP